MSFILGLTGPTGAGKGVFSACAKELGFNIIDCDLVARQAVKKGMPALLALTKAFGQDILLKNGELDRKKLAAVAFSDTYKTELLNKTVLPYIKELVIKEIEGDKVLLDAPTLFESGVNKICDKTVAVLASENLRKGRIILRDNIDESAADIRLFAGKPDEFYYNNADEVIINNGDLKSFKKRVKIYLENIIGGTENERV